MEEYRLTVLLFNYIQQEIKNEITENSEPSFETVGSDPVIRDFWDDEDDDDDSDDEEDEELG